jgi:hypothetical protein
MNKILLLIIVGALCVQCKKAQQTAVTSNEASTSDSIVKDTIPLGAAILMKVYSDCVKDFRDGYLIMADGSQILYDDKREKDFETMLDESSPKDMFAMPYDRNREKPKYLADAGRSRCEQLFKSMYGHNAAEVQKQMEKVEWFGQQIQFSKTNGCSDSLRAVACEMSKHPKYLDYMKQASTFYWRAVRGAKRQSAHSYGIAIDINTQFSNYWLWTNKGAKETDKIIYENRIPIEIVHIFERYGFIWGGRWYHYDTMHFEFRPELLKH